MKISLTKLNVKELAELSKKTVDLSNSGKFAGVENNELLINLAEKFAVYNKLYNKLTYSGKGKSVAEADKKRDQLYNGFKAFLKGYTVSGLLPNHAEAEKVYEVFKVYGLNLSSLNYAEESAQLRRLVADLESPNIYPFVEQLGATNLFTQLKQAQAEFDAIFSEQVQSNAELRNLPSATNTRAELEEVLRAYFAFVKVMNKQEPWKQLYYELNEIVKSIRPNVYPKKETTAT